MAPRPIVLESPSQIQGNFKGFVRTTLAGIPQAIEAARLVFLQFRAIDQLCANRIEVDIVANTSDRVPIQQDRFITTLKYMTICLPEAIETIGKRRLQPLHALH